MRTMKEWFTTSKAVLSMLLVQVIGTGMQLLSRVILVEGSSICALIAYRHVVAAICVAPFALYFERDRTKKFSCRVLFWLFINALMGMALAQGLFYYGLRDTSATYSANFLNLIPIFTFFTSIICRMENLVLQTRAGKAKCVGAILCVGGALVTGLYKGKQFSIDHHSHHLQIAAHRTHMLRGSFFLIGSCFSYTAWFIAQVMLLKVFPLRYWGTMLTCIVAAIQAAIMGVFIDSNKASWRLNWNLQLITILYSGALNTAASFCLLSWAIMAKGPTYPPIFNPLCLIFVALSEAIVLGQPLGVGMLVGMVLIITGLYFFLWGKKNDTQHLPQPIVAAVEGSTVMADGPQSTCTVIQSSSPINAVVLEIEKTEKN
ncbi:WAT1-related protein At5g64700 isoform X2 [Cajanus cajan]|uniref:WAT1-related protein n=1 Tax=Cajanus cajan TaxID=3821 RepID=A0A151R1R3_CAJCA|nr:WAT1-related protein At5g64700 isoform X1 [Cajanus cajan]XP_020205505.1 WAT1-related protein At5g64700 isoform X2 [Cajanus cajan]KYP36514.1 Auxin-induced protein 5NG4 [Cajanus cajan]